MEFTLKGDYFNGSFDRPEGVSSIDIENTCEKITKYSPANLDHKLWDAYINYENTSKVIASAHCNTPPFNKSSGFKVLAPPMMKGNDTSKRR